MKNLILLLSVFLLSVSFSFSQSPQAFKYQTVVRDATGDLLENDNVSFRIGVRDSLATGTLLYQETFTLTTNQFGLANFEIGNGTPEPGSGVFADIDWGTNSKYLELELDPDGGDAYSLIGTSQILSVLMPCMPTPQDIAKIRIRPFQMMICMLIFRVMLELALKIL